MHHLTHTGYYAGALFCGMPRQALPPTDTTSHLPYSDLDRFFARQDICPACRSVWDAAADDTDTEGTAS